MTAHSDWEAPGVTDARIPGGDFRKLGPINWVVNKIAAWVIGAPRMYLFATLGQHKLLFQIWFIFGAWSTWPLSAATARPAAGNLILFILLFLVGYKVFGPPIHG